MKIKQILVIDDSTLIFTENPEKDIEAVKSLYKDDERDGYMGYELPELTEFEFLGTKYKAISFWHDNEDIREIDLGNLLE